MTAYNLLCLIGALNDEDILEAKTGHYSETVRPNASTGIPAMRRRKRATLYIAAAVVFILGSLCVAMAVSEDFRDEVFSFFHISTPDVALPLEDRAPLADGLAFVFEKNLEEAVEIEHIRIQGNFDYGRGLIYLYGETEKDTAFYTARDGQLEKLETRITELTHTWEGREYSVEFSWCEWEEDIYVHSAGKTPAQDSFWYVTPISGRTDAVILTLADGRQENYSEYPFLVNLDTQEVTDILYGCGIEQSSGIQNVLFSPNLSGALITCGEQSMVYYLDIESKTLLKLPELVGTSVSAAWFLDEETVCCYSVDGEGICSCYRISLSANQAIEVFSGLSIYSGTSEPGFLFTGTRYGLYIDSDCAVQIYDLKTGTHAIAEGLLCSRESIAVTMNAEGTKMLIAVLDSTSTSLNICQLGVLDMEKRTVTFLDREGYEIRDETAIGWFDNDRIFILAANSSGEKYLYLYAFI